MTALEGLRLEGTGSATKRAVASILLRIERGEVELGGRLPPERQLARELDCSRQTVRRALEVLEKSGEVRRRSGRRGGTFALKPNPNWPMYSWSRLAEGSDRRVARPLGVDVSVPEFLSRQHFTVSTRIVYAGFESADPVVSGALNISPGSPVIAVKRVRSADQVPLSWERLSVPPSRFPNLLNYPLNGSLTEIFNEVYGIEAAKITEKIMIRIAESHHGEYLDVSAGQPLLSITRTSFDSSSNPFEFSYDLFRADRTELVISSSRVADSL
ncbi:GntR family transcriptional regulator [Corynebacterium neomassiliense]|uniref:GntR family transcriptional regulator n=1 Tax=Corynebacterium neomassiliense TaxID=2079482 RepID=UPI0013869262